MLRIDVLLVMACGAFVLAPQAIGRPGSRGLLLSIDERGARYPLTMNPIAQQAYLKASTTEAGDQFGFSVAVSDDTVVVGAFGEDSNATGVNGDQSNNGAEDSGAAYVFVRSGTIWSQQAYLKASDTTRLAKFGSSVAVSGDTVVVGAPRAGAASAGAAYVFVRSGTTWSQQARLQASNPGNGDSFGHSLALSGDTAVVGALGEDSNTTGVNGNQSNNGANNSGAAYVFARSGASWSQQAYLKASNTEPFDEFGQSVAVSGDTVVVGAIGEASNTTGVNGDESNNDALYSGATYVFVRSGTSWSQQAYLKASNAEEGDPVGDLFGWSVAVSGDTVGVGARYEDSGATGVGGDQQNDDAMDSGAAYVFVRNRTTWSQQAYLKASNTGLQDEFGYALALSGDSVVIGALREQSSATGVNGDQSDNSSSSSGAAYVFVRGGTTWSQQAYVKASNTGVGDLLGVSVAVSGDVAVVGAWSEDSNATGVNGEESNEDAPSSGAVYVFGLCPQAAVATRNGGTNPASYAASPAVLGATLTATVNNTLAGQVSSLLFAFDTAASLPLGGGQTLLCLDLGSGELFTGAGLTPSSSSGGLVRGTVADFYTLAVPNDLTLCGVALYSQAVQLGIPPFVLSNAQDLTIGSF